MSPATLVLLAITAQTAPPQRPAPAPAGEPPAAADAFQPDPAWRPVAPAMWIDPRDRSLVLRTRVALRDGPLEHLLCLKGTKEHESILATLVGPPARDFPPKAAPAGRPRELSYAEKIRAALTRLGAEPGQPVRFLPEFAPPKGPAIAITLEWEEGGRRRRADARSWVLDERRNTRLTWAVALASASGASASPAASSSPAAFFSAYACLKLATEPVCLEQRDWVFAGSRHETDPTTKEPYFLADDGDLITVANFASAVLDLPFASSASDAERGFVARASQIPPRGTGVTVFLRPRVGPAPPAR